MKQVNQEAFSTIIDCFSGADGGVSFTKLRLLLEDMEAEESDTGNQVVDIMTKFAKLIKVANRKQF